MTLFLSEVDGLIYMASFTANGWRLLTKVLYTYNSLHCIVLFYIFSHVSAAQVSLNWFTKPRQHKADAPGLYE